MSGCVIASQDVASGLPSSAVPVWPVPLPIVSNSGEAGLGFFHLGLRKRVNVFERFNPFAQLFEPLKYENTSPAPTLSSAADLVRPCSYCSPGAGRQRDPDGFFSVLPVSESQRFCDGCLGTALISQKIYFGCGVETANSKRKVCT